MPNWCDNELTIIGRKDELSSFSERYSNKDTQLSLNLITPRPEGMTDWYDWSVKHWGTKWDIEATSEFTESAYFDPVGDDPISQITYKFMSAWGPPDVAIKTLIRRYPDFCFAMFYVEPGMCFHGWLSGSKGDIRAEECKDEIPRHDTGWMANELWQQ